MVLHPENVQRHSETLSLRRIAKKRKDISFDLSRKQVVEKLDGIGPLIRLSRIHGSPKAPNVFSWIDKGQQPHHPLFHALHTIRERLAQERSPLDCWVLPVGKKNRENREPSTIEHHVRDNSALYDLSVHLEICEAAGHLFESKNDC